MPSALFDSQFKVLPAAFELLQFNFGVPLCSFNLWIVSLARVAVIIIYKVPDVELRPDAVGHEIHLELNTNNKMNLYGSNQNKG